MKIVRNLVMALALSFVVVSGNTTVFAGPWRFGVMGDTQWTCPTDPAGQNPDGVPESIIRQINREFVAKGVKFVIQVGDLTENGNDADIAARAKAARGLYDNDIGFFPMRGNHDTYAKPEGSNNYGIPAVQNIFPQTRGLGATFGAAHFNSPTAVSPDLNGMSYSFDFGPVDGSARFVIIDNWATPSKRVDAADYRYGYSLADQQAWIGGRLEKNTRGTMHAFVLSHQPLIAENHQDSPFTGYTNANPDMQNNFFASLAANGVGYYISGHDHIHQRSLVTSPDGNSRVQEVIAASNSSKFYTPKPLSDPKWYGQKVRETPISQEMYSVGYYVCTVDGPRVTVDYYSDDHGKWVSDNCYPEGGTPESCASNSPAGTHVTPVFNFVKRETWGYSLNGKEMLVPSDGSYALADDTSKAIGRGESGYGRTTAKILNGINSRVRKDRNDRPMVAIVDTGWAPKDARNLASDIFFLWGLAEFGDGTTDPYTLSLTYTPHLAKHTGKGHFSLGAKDPNGQWVNAVRLNVSGVPKFVKGPWNASRGLGTYGIDTRTGTVWAVVNYNGNFAVINPTSAKSARVGKDGS